MHSPFPGMDPYLESRQFWRSFHHHLAEKIAIALNRTISPKYYADVEVHFQMEELTISAQRSIYPDVGVLKKEPSAVLELPAQKVATPLVREVIVESLPKSRTVEIRLANSKELVTSIEILSPANKRGNGLVKYREKRREILSSNINLVEIDLLRAGKRPGVELFDLDIEYILLVNAATGTNIRASKIWPVALNESLPTLPIPLLPEDAAAFVVMGDLLQMINADFLYSTRIDYDEPVPSPRLRPEMGKWWEQRWIEWEREHE